MRISAANIVFIGLLSVCLAGCLSSCRKEEPVLQGEGDHVGGGESGEIKGFFLLNEGNMGSNKATLDYYDLYTQYLSGAQSGSGPRARGRGQ